jgi:hypothetical protein
MTNMYCKPAFLLFLAATLAACGDSSPPPADEQSLASADKYPADSERSPGKPTPPIRFRY